MDNTFYIVLLQLGIMNTALSGYGVMELAKFVDGDDEILYCHGNLIIPLIKRG